MHIRLTLFKRGDVSSVTHKLLTTSLVVTCDSVISLLGNHIKCFSKVIYSKLIFSVMLCKCCMVFMSADYIKMDYFYDGSKHNESRTYRNSCHVHNFLSSVVYYGTRGSTLQTVYY